MSNSPPKVCVVGSSNIDLMFRTSRLPAPGETLAGHSFSTGFGGKGANQAVMAAKLGAQVALISKVGNDLFGQSILGNFRDRGIGTDFVRIDDARSTGVASIVIDEAGRNCILLVPGANGGLTPDEVRDAAAVIGAADVLLCQLEVSADATQEALRIARRNGVCTILNPAPAVPLSRELLGLCDWCIPNETEVEILTGERVASLNQAGAAARRLLEQGPKGVILTLGERGVWIDDGIAPQHLPAISVKAVDTTGAGDVWIGSLAVFLAEGDSVRSAAYKANAAAALSVTGRGAQSSFPSRKDVEEFLTK